MKRTFLVIVIMGAWLFALLLPGDATSAPPKGWPTLPGSPVISGTVSLGKIPFGESASLPRMATLHVELMDISGNAPGGILGEETIWLSTGRLPVDFRIPYDPSRINPDHSYMVRARILVGEKVLFLNTTPYYVLTRGAPSKVDIVVIPAQSRLR